jgi:hypothetical protein
MLKKSVTIHLRAKNGKLGGFGSEKEMGREVGANV